VRGLSKKKKKSNRNISFAPVRLPVLDAGMDHKQGFSLRE
jgi:hypothetical protein